MWDKLICIFLKETFLIFKQKSLCNRNIGNFHFLALQDNAQNATILHIGQDDISTRFQCDPSTEAHGAVSSDMTRRSSRRSLLGYKVKITVVRQIKSKSSTNSPYLSLIHFKHTLSILEVHRTNRTVSVSPLLGRRDLGTSRYCPSLVLKLTYKKVSFLY